MAGPISEIIGRVRWWFYNLTCLYMSRCRVCGSNEDVVAYDPRGLWAYFFRRTVCPEHCAEHDFNRHRDGTYCDHCGQEPPFD